MNLKTMLLAVMTGVLLAATAAVHAGISRDQAETIALAQVPGGEIVGGGLDQEGETLVWSFDLSLPRSRNFTEVRIDADSGRVIAVRKQTPAEQLRSGLWERQ